MFEDIRGFLPHSENLFTGGMPNPGRMGKPHQTKS